ncbi:MAG: hypothetical protein ABEH77_02505, partial [Halobacteriaceae archaeon]
GPLQPDPAAHPRDGVDDEADAPHTRTRAVAGKPLAGAIPGSNDSNETLYIIFNEINEIKDYFERN